MPDKRLEQEALKILTEMGACVPDSQALVRGQRVLAEALERAEQRGRKASERETEVRQ